MRRALLAVLGACSFEPGTLPADARIFEDVAIDAPLGPWGMPTVIALAAPANTDDDPTLTGDLLEMFINASARTGNADVLVTVRSSTTAAWSTPILVPAMVSSTANETTPEVSLDGLSLIVASDRMPTQGGSDLWLFTRTSRGAPWSGGVSLTELGSNANDTAGNMTEDQRTIVFTSARAGSSDIFLANRPASGGLFNAPVIQTALNTPFHEGSPHMTPDGLTVYFDSDRNAPGTVDLDIYVSRRTSRSEPFPAPMPVTEINTTMSEQDPWISPDGRRLLFSSNRGGMNELWEATR
jgi:Tol biopolymer transport system component